MVSYLILVVAVLIISLSCVADKVFPLVLRLFQIRSWLPLAAHVMGAVFANAAQHFFLSGGEVRASCFDCLLFGFTGP